VGTWSMDVIELILELFRGSCSHCNHRCLMRKLCDRRTGGVYETKLGNG
jgi:hypothetical protein